MAVKNQMVTVRKFRTVKIRQLVKLLAVHFNAAQLDEIANYNRNTLNRHLTELWG